MCAVCGLIIARDNVRMLAGILFINMSVTNRAGFGGVWLSSLVVIGRVWWLPWVACVWLALGNLCFIGCRVINLCVKVRKGGFCIEGCRIR